MISRGLRLRALAVIVGCGAAFAIGESALRLFKRARHERPVQDDPRLGVRPKRFRNLDARSSAAIVAIGDSQTWGVNATVRQTWPSELERRTGLPVQNLSMGGYAPPQYLALLEEARALQPRDAVVGLYMGNDLWEAYRTVYTLDAWAPLRRTGARLPVDDDPVKAAADHYWTTKVAFISRYGRWPPGRWHVWLRGHSAVARLFDSAGLLPGEEPWGQAARAWAAASGGEALSVPGLNPTVLAIAFRASALDLREPRIEEGLRLSRQLIGEMAKTAAAAGIRLTLVFIPTKETVYAGAFPELSQRPALAKLVANERVARTEIGDEAACHRVPVFDASARLADRLRGGARLYPSTEDGHFAPSGYAELAALVEEALRQRGGV